MKIYSLLLSMTTALVMAFAMLPGALAADAAKSDLLNDPSTMTTVTSPTSTNFIDSSTCKDCVKNAITSKGCKQGFSQPPECQRLFDGGAKPQIKSKGSEAAE